mgnify:FL=1
MNKFQEEIWQLLSEGYNCRLKATIDDKLVAVVYDKHSVYLVTADPHDDTSVDTVALDEEGLGMLKEAIAFQKNV